MLNKYSALLIVLLILIIGYYFTSRKSEKNITKKKGTKKSFRKKKKTKGKKSSRSSESEDAEDEDEADDSEENDENTDDDAEELYNLVHEPLCKGLQYEEFEEIVGDLAGSIVFIELKQLYNQCADKNVDPMRTITIQDYVRILKKDDNGE